MPALSYLSSVYMLRRIPNTTALAEAKFARSAEGPHLFGQFAITFVSFAPSSGLSRRARSSGSAHSRPANSDWRTAWSSFLGT